MSPPLAKPPTPSVTRVERRFESCEWKPLMRFPKAHSCCRDGQRFLRPLPPHHRLYLLFVLSFKVISTISGRLWLLFGLAQVQSGIAPSFGTWHFSPKALPYDTSFAALHINRLFLDERHWMAHSSI
jgi:hypothetical protein